MKLPLEERLIKPALPLRARITKRCFDLCLALALSPLLIIVVVPCVLGAKLSTGHGFFRQWRVGQHGKLFEIWKISSMRDIDGIVTTVTKGGDPRITRFGRILRKTKADEIPQLINIFKGEMSFVGPRPDVPDVFEAVPEKFAPVLCLKPGITGPASIAFRDEETLLLEVEDAEHYNKEVLFPKKMEYNLEYINRYSFWVDMKILVQTFVGAPNELDNK